MSRARKSFMSLTFQDLGLSPFLLKALAQEGYAEPTPIQAQAIPPVLDGRDLMGLARTGTGKTAAFALPIIQMLTAHRQHPGARAARCLILSPTRELAGQIAESFRTYGQYAGLRGAVVYGGASMGKQIKSLERGVDVLIATPGRLLDLIQRRAVQLHKVETLVLDEADQMMDMGFIKPIRQIAGFCPAERQTLMFSATMPPEIEGLAREFLVDPAKVSVVPTETTAEKVAQRAIWVEQASKPDLLADVLSDAAMSRVIVFARTKHGADRVANKLEAQGFAAAAIHGNKSQGQRQRALDAFKSGQARVLVATDVAARGIDISGVTHVVNYDLPEVPEAYVHRIGRTARAGAEGVALTFVTPAEAKALAAIERTTKVAITVQEHALGTAAPAPGARVPGGPHKRGGGGRPQHNQQRRNGGGGHGGGQRRGGGGKPQGQRANG
jgi:ATP-dependent RNA helicase RhlE